MTTLDDVPRFEPFWVEEPEPLPVLERPWWHAKAACREVDREVFFPERSQGGDTAAARAVCFTCPVTDDCLSFALDHQEWHGVWGGLSVEQRRRIKAAGRRGGNRPPADGA